ncbi:MAG: GntR family transcriptional regulator [Bacteroidales bacterium]|nr:GntR family transcriptional regulator [Bacteroidales bacterium]
MDFSSNKPIYLQIYDTLCDRILSGSLPVGERILSVREMGAELGVNPNTVMRSYEKMTAEGIVFNKRGIGYFVSEDAVETVLKAQRREFIENELPLVLKRMKLLGLDPKELLIEK